MPYTLSEFKEWLMTNPQPVGEFTGWDTVLSVWNEESWNKILLKAIQGSISSNSPTLPIVQRWIIEKDNNYPIRETVLNRWHLLHYRMITKQDNWKKHSESTAKTNQEQLNWIKKAIEGIKLPTSPSDPELEKKFSTTRGLLKHIQQQLDTFIAN